MSINVSGADIPGVVSKVQKSITFTGATGYGAIGNVVYFTITGAVHVVSLDAVIETSLTEDAGTGVSSCSLGVVNATTLFIAAALSSVLLSSAPLWYTGTAPSANGVALDAKYKDIAIAQNIVLAVTSTGTRKVIGGVITLTVTYMPITSIGSLV